MTSFEEWQAQQNNPQANLNIRLGVEANPDQAASTTALARRYGVTPAIVEADPALFGLRAKAEDAQSALRGSPKAQAWMAGDIQRAKIAHDDVGILGGIESGVKGFFGGIARGIDRFIMDDTPARVVVPQVAQKAPAALGAGVISAASGLAGAGEAVSGAFARVSPADWLQRQAVGSSINQKFEELFGRIRVSLREKAREVSPDVSEVGFVGRSILGGVESIPVSFAALGTTLATGNPWLGASAGGLVQGGQSFGTARDQDVGFGKSLAYGATDALTETVTEFFPEAKFLRDTRAGSSVLMRFLGNQLQEQLGEQAATALQDLSAWAVLPENKDKTFGDYLAARPEAALSTAIQTLVIGGATSSTVTAIEQLAKLPAVQARADARAGRVAESQQHAGELKNILELAAKSKLRERDAATFESFMHAQTEDGPVEDVYIDASELSKLLQEGGPAAQQLADAIPAIREQYAQAVVTGGDVRIPVSQIAAYLPGSELEQAFVQHLRADPLDVSAADAQVQTEDAANQMQQDFERQLGTSMDDQAFAASRDAVTQHFTDQLDTANRFTADTNQQYGTLLSSFYAVQAAKLGITPEEMLKRYPLQVRSVSEDVPGGERLDQAATAETFTREGVRDLLQRDGWAIMTAENPNAEKRSDSENAKANAAMRAELEAAGYDVTPIAGHYGQPESSFIVRGIGQQEALDFGKRFGQESVLTRAGLVYADSTVNPATGVTIFDARPDDFFSQLPDGTTFSVDIDFDARVPLARTGGTKVVDAAGRPKVVYHGTPFDFTDFEDRARPDWFTEDPKLAAAYADPRRVRKGAGANVRPVYLDIQNPLDLSGHLSVVDDPAAFARSLGLEVEGIELGIAPAYAVFTHPKFIEAAKRAGYDGLKVEEGDATTWAPFSAAQIKPRFSREAQLFTRPDLQKVAQGPRGYLTFGQDITAQPSTIALLSASDLSTFLHESGHFFLEVMSHMAAQPGAPATVVADMETTLKWLGVEGGNAAWSAMTLEQKRAYHEQFARGFEVYLFEGKAPSIEMRGVFQRFRAWLLNVYKQKTALDVEISDEMRGVFDRMLASSEAITEAEQDAGMAPALTERPEGMTEADWADYQTLGTEATAEAIDALQARSLRDMRFAARAQARELKRLQAEVKEQRQQVEAEVRAEIDAQPVFRAIDFMRRGLLDGTPAEGPTKIDIAALEGLYEDRPKLVVDETKRALGFGKYGMLAREGGVNPEQIAERFGFTSADELVQAVLNAPNRTTEIEAATELRMLERYGDLTSPAALEAAAAAAVHNDVRARFVATELAALDKAPGKPRLLARAAKDYADRIVARLKVRDIRPLQYEAAERRAADRAVKAVKKGDTETAAAEKRNQLVNLYATRAARAAQEEVRKAVAYFRKFESPGVRDKVDGAYLDQIDAMLERFELRASVSGKEMQRRATLAAWIESQREKGFEPAISPELEDASRRQHYRDLTLEELRGLRDAITNIEHLGRLKERLLKNKEEREFGRAVETASAAINENAYKVVSQPLGTPTWLERAKSGLGDFFAMHRKFASTVREMDGFADGGPLWGLLTRPLNDAADTEATMTEQSTVELGKIFDALRGQNLHKRVYVPEIGRSISLETRLMIAANWGNEINRERVLTGENWTPQQVQAIFASLTPEHWTFVRNVWAHFDSFWPQIAAKEKRVSGVEPERVEAAPFTVVASDGSVIELPGGYFPIKYDADRSSRAEADIAAEVQSQMTRGLYTRATTRRGHTKARVESTGRALRYDFGVIFQHDTEVIHDLAWHETLIDVNRLLRAGPIDAAIREHYGPATLRWMRNALSDIAIGHIGAQNALERGVNYLRTGATIAGLGWNLYTSLLQPLGLTQSMQRIGPKWVARGLSRVFRDAASMKATSTWVYEQSDFMRLRAKTQQREIEEIRNKVSGKSALRNTVEASFFILIAKAQLMADVPTWVGAYEKAVESGEHHERATALADQAVLDSQGGGQIKDLAGIQRGGPFMKLWTNFYSYFSVTYNRMAESVNETRKVGPSRLPLLAADFALLAILPSVLATAMRYALHGGDDWEDLWPKLVEDQFSYMLGTVFGLRELGAMFGVGHAYGGPAGARAISATVDLGKQAQQGELDEAFFRAANAAAGVLFHYPAGQVDRTARGIEALADGKTRNPLAILFGPPPKD